jgi:hypothetical protein
MYEKQQQQNNDDFNSLFDNEFKSHLSEINEEITNNDTNDNQPTKRHQAVMRHSLNRIRTEDGRIEIITPRMSSWYISYVMHPLLECNKFL